MKRFFFLIIAVMCMLLPISNAFAAALDLNRESSLTLNLAYSRKAIQGMGIRISLVAGFEKDDRENVKFVINDEFKNAGIDLSGKIDTERNIDLSKTLLTFTNKNAVTWLNQTSDINGRVLFSGIKTGLYLVAQFGDNANYKIAPFLITIPLLDDINGQYIYDVDTFPKTSPEEISVSPPPESPTPTTSTTTPTVTPSETSDDPEPDPDPDPSPSSSPTPTPSASPSPSPSPSEVSPSPSEEEPTEEENVPPLPPSNPIEPPAPEAAASDSPIFLLDSDTPEGAPEFDPTLNLDDGLTPTGVLPQTGMLLWPVPVLLSFGSTSLVLGVMMISKEKKRYE